MEMVKNRYSPDAMTERFCHGLRDAICKGGRPKTASEAAKRAFVFVKGYADLIGVGEQVVLIKPNDPRCPSRDHYWLVWEGSDMHDWGVPASFAAMDAVRECVETHYGFDLCFYTK